MNILEKLGEINEDNYFDPYYLSNATANWPLIPLYMDFDEQGNPIPEDDPEMEPLDLENWKITEIGDRYMIVKCGGDWQQPYEMRIELNSDDELECVSFQLTDYGVGEELNINFLLGYEDEDEME